MVPVKEIATFGGRSRPRPYYEKGGDMKRYFIFFQNGHTMKYTEFRCMAADVDQAKEQLFDVHGANFEHIILFIIEDGATIYERK